MDFAEYLRKPDVSENSKVFYRWFLRNERHAIHDAHFVEIVVLVKTDEMYKTFKSLLANRFWSRDECGIGWSKFLLESVFQCPYVYYILALLSGRLHLHVTISYCFSFIKFRFKSNINNIISKNLNSSISLQFIISLFNM